MSLHGKNILLGVCGGIAAYKSPGLVRALIKAGAGVQTILTQSGEKFIGRATLSTLTKREVLTDLFPDGQAITTEHISASDWAHCLLVAPATANCLAKFAHGIADDFLSTTYLSLNTPVILAPSMNERMWFHAAVQNNLELLKKRGVHIIEPGTGDLACGMEGKGRLPAEETILFHVQKALSAQDLKDKRILITCGGTAEALDPVRVITNKSSGKMGVALAVNALERGADVTLLHGNVTVNIPGYVRTVRAESGKAMLDNVTRLFKNSDMLIMAAAVSDFAPESIAQGKIKKNGGTLRLNLRETVDILKTVSKNKGKRKVIGFALENAAQGEENARRKLKEKNCDLLVLNAPSALGSANNRITLLRKTGPIIRCDETTKEAAAKIILDYAAAL